MTEGQAVEIRNGVTWAGLISFASVLVTVLAVVLGFGYSTLEDRIGDTNKKVDEVNRDLGGRIETALLELGGRIEEVNNQHIQFNIRQWDAHNASDDTVQRLLGAVEALQKSVDALLQAERARFERMEQNFMRSQEGKGG